MPKKTRKEKIRADVNRMQNHPLVFSYSQQTVTANQKTIQPYGDFSLIKADIYKTLLWAVVFIAFEITVFILTKKFGW